MNINKNLAEDTIDESLSILVVEDDDGLRRLIQKRLERKKFKVEAIETGESALARLMSNPDVLLLLDYKLPDMTGRELIENLVENGYSVPFVIITGHGDERIAVEMMKLGARDYIVKDQALLEVLPQVMEQIHTQIITQKKLSQVKKALHESEERFRQMADNINQIFWLNSVDFKEVFYVSPAFEDVYGYPRESIYKNPEILTNAVHPKDRERIKAILTQKDKNGKSEEFRVVRADDLQIKLLLQ